MRLVCISDTHGRHDHLLLPPGDVLVHAGDFCGVGDADDIREFARWFHRQPFAHRVVVAGNHDLLFESDPVTALQLLRSGCPGVHYLHDSGVEIDGLRYWGSPWQPRFMNWAFNLERGEPMRQVWARVPDEIDILITHGPPHGILDRTRHGDRVGCEELLAALPRIQPRVHIFGHIHEGAGQLKAGGVHYVNASSLDATYSTMHPAMVLEV
ncbi:MAG: metallophosphatase domain-containing protein [Planctomycetes bacterium]|nr:metallophosphatase domain-containing protein [Planctomycetota bacterium]